MKAGSATTWSDRIILSIVAHLPHAIFKECCPGLEFSTVKSIHFNNIAPGIHCRPDKTEKEAGDIDIAGG